ncbi:spore germination protein [Metabacillus dongyingensis]|uniref:spore germination protein n=1 Tax=Metabacillus dongyingensis TaxID=2874282 RepID=UPI001FB2344D|nr:spore germination protein [Metabacillus dongyingensis]UNJ81430.1 Nutrient germinant receptor inner membrane subunit A (GerKA/GerAA/GerBA) [Metabacillus dongyingensis]
MFKKKNNQNPEENQTPAEIVKRAKKSSDFKEIKKNVSGIQIYILYFTTLIDHKTMERVLLPYINEYEKKKDQFLAINQFINNLPLEDVIRTQDAIEIEEKIHQGYVLIKFENTSEDCLLVNVNNLSKGLRESNETENEFNVIGPKLGFVESLDTNILLLRTKIKSPLLTTEELVLGTLSKTRVIIVYLDGITNEEHIETVKKRLSEIDFDIIWDTSAIDQIIRDNSHTPFPLYLTTERLDRLSYSLTSGQVVILSDGSPYAISGPSTILDFFLSSEDYYYNWVIGSFFRFTRIFAIIFSIFSSSIYVAVVTFHYEVIPADLLGPLIESRANVPFPPLLEVLFLEMTIELLREAGARLPTKVGQTLGIVGGIVIGQAAVSAALTSNILLIIIALSALASFTTPSMVMSNTIRILRFPFIIMSSLLGGLGIMIGFTVLLCHLFKLKSFETPYMVPLYPFRVNNLSDSIFRPPFNKLNKRPDYLRPKDKMKYSPIKRNKKKEDINDE